MDKPYLSNRNIRKYGAMIISLFASLFLLLLILFYLFTLNCYSDFREFIINNYKILISPIIGFFVVCFPVQRIIKKYIPDELCCQKKEDIYEFMKEFINKSTSRVTIVSNSLNWLNEDEAKDVKFEIFRKLKSSIQVEIIVSSIQEDLEKELIHYNALIYKRKIRPMSRFTVINSSRPNAAELAIAKGAIPKHIISVYTYNDNPHIIELALDMISQTTGKGYL